MAVNFNSAILSPSSGRTASFRTTPATNAPATNVVYVDQNGNPLPTPALAQAKPQQVVVKNELSFDVWETVKSAWPIVAGFVGITFLAALASVFVNHRSKEGFVNKKSAETIATEGLDYLDKIDNVEKHLETIGGYDNLSDQQKRIVTAAFLLAERNNLSMEDKSLMYDLCLNGKINGDMSSSKILEILKKAKEN